MLEIIMPAVAMPFLEDFRPSTPSSKPIRLMHMPPIGIQNEKQLKMPMTNDATLFAPFPS